MWLFIGLGILFSIVTGFLSYHLAFEKGRSGQGYFWIGFFLNVIGLIYVVGLPAKSVPANAVPAASAGASSAPAEIAGVVPVDDEVANANERRDRLQSIVVAAGLIVLLGVATIILTSIQ